MNDWLSSHQEIAQDRDVLIADKTRPTYLPHVLAFVTILTLVLRGIAVLLGRSNNDFVVFLPTCLLTAGVVMIGAEFYCVVTASHRITSLFTSQQIDFLRLTSLRREDLFATLYGSAQSHCRKALAAEIIVRVVTAEWAILNGFQSCQAAACFYPLAILLPLFLLIVFLVEAYWRFELMVALSVALSTRVRNFPFAALAGLYIIGSIHFLQFMLLVVPLGLIQLAFGQSNEPIVELLNFALRCCLTPIGVIVGWVILFWIYKVGRDRALTYAQRELFRPE